MTSREEIGGYLELECYGKEAYHAKAIALNTGRNALRYIIKAYGISEIFVPYYTCPVICEVLKEENCDALFYDIDTRFLPRREFPDGAFILANNYFGICGDSILSLKGKYRNLIVDNAQSFYSPPCGLASFYSPRKFFGLPDGGILYCDKTIDVQFERDISFGRMAHLLKRHDLSAEEGYVDFKSTEASLSKQPIKRMSKLTEALMGNIDYERARKQRCENFDFLHENLYEINELDLSHIADVPMVYPLLIKDASLRGELISKGIYTARYWAGVKDFAPCGSFAAYASENLLPLPIDQRYTISDMRRVADVIVGRLKA